MERWRLEAMKAATALMAELIETFPEPDPVGRVKPIEFYEIMGGRYDGSYQLHGECERCGSRVSHIIDADMLEAPESADVYARVAHCMCEAYELPRPTIPTGLFLGSGPYYPDPTATPFGFQTGGLR